MTRDRSRRDELTRQVPIQKVATQELNLDTHVIDTFTGWTPPTPINLIVAVSFGLFVPPRILNLAKYGGVNVHPSLLPDLRGPAPIHHALLKRRSHTGISVQTLHPNHFDKGLVLAQTPQPGIEVGAGTSPPKLTDRLGQEGAEMLVEVLKTRAFVPPLEDVGWYAASGGSIAHAEKVTKQHRYIDFSNTTIQDIVTVKRVLGDPWCILPNGDRLILNEIQESSFSVEAGQTGLWIPEGSITPLARTADGAILQIEKSTYEGGKTGGGNARLARVLKAGT